MAKNEKNNEKIAKPIVKWAGGKTQLLNSILPKVPKDYGRYIEPFVGGGALFFALRPKNAVIADSNPELINMYQEIAVNVDKVIEILQGYRNTKEDYYDIRKQDWTKLPKEESAARMIYLNKTCFNGLYRVNKKGEFNTPYGNYKNPKICDEENLRLASELLQDTEIVCGDYLKVLKKFAHEDDFVFLDPPYIPVTKYGDFKRYTKDQFSEEDQRNLAKEVARLYKLGCYVILTNSNHPLAMELYAPYQIETVKAKRSISSKTDTRTGEDIIVTAFPSKTSISLPAQMKKFPPTRFMGSKSKLLPQIWTVASQFSFDTVLDLFSGTGVVGYMFKSQGKAVTCNDYMSMCYVFAKAMIENSDTTLPIEEAEDLLKVQKESDHFVATTFKGLYFTDEENELIDTLRTNIADIEDPYKNAIAMTALIRACIKKRPRGLFTYTGNRYDDGRKDLKKSMKEQFLEAVQVVNEAVFDNGKQNTANNGDALTLDAGTPDLVYIDPPYYSKVSDNEYVRRYHFVEGLARDWEGVVIQQDTKTKKFKSYPTPFSSCEGATKAFDKLFKKYADSIQIVSYSSNCLPAQDQMVEMMEKYKDHVDVVPIDYTYSFGNQKTAKTHRNNVQEYLFIGYNEGDLKNE